MRGASDAIPSWVRLRCFGLNAFAERHTRVAYKNHCRSFWEINWGRDTPFPARMRRESRRQLVPLLLRSVLVQSHEGPKTPTNKIKTARLADRMGIMVTALYDKLIGCGYLELRNGRRTLTEKGREMGGELEPGKETSFLWPPDLTV